MLTKRVIITLSILLLSIGMNLWQYSRLRLAERKPYYYEIDQPFIDKAVTLWSNKTSEPIERVMDGRYVKAIYFDNEICISLALETGSVGGVPVYCFNDKNFKLTRRYDDVE